MKGFLYILRSTVNQRYYIGSTNDIARRLAEHNAGESKSTRFIRPLALVYHQEYPTPREARQAEYRLKKLKSRRLIEELINMRP